MSVDVTYKDDRIYAAVVHSIKRAHINVKWVYEKGLLSGK